MFYLAHIIIYLLRKGGLYMVHHLHFFPIRASKLHNKTARIEAGKNLLIDLHANKGIVNHESNIITIL